MIFTIGDLHLGFSVEKPMDIFGDNWKSHDEQIKLNWINSVQPGDTVILLGDFSWGIDLNEAKADFEFLNSLPGTKILSKGNHDYYWTTLKKMNEFLKVNNFENIYFMQNNSYVVENKIIVGTRGWVTNYESQDDYKILKRECERLKLSINDGLKKIELLKNNDKSVILNQNKDNDYEQYEMIAFLHYPPFYKEQNIPDEINFRKIIKDAGIIKCYYAHLHGASHSEAIEGTLDDGITYKLVSSDYLGFNLWRID